MLSSKSQAIVRQSSQKIVSKINAFINQPSEERSATKNFLTQLELEKCMKIILVSKSEQLGFMSIFSQFGPKKYIITNSSRYYWYLGYIPILFENIRSQWVELWNSSHSFHSWKNNFSSTSIEKNCLSVMLKISS